MAHRADGFAGGRLLGRAVAGLALNLFATAAFAAAGSGGISASDNNTHVDRGVYYSNSSFLTASGGTAPYTFVATGMPSGIALNSNGTLTGVTCGSNGNFTLNLAVTDSTGATATFTNKVLIVNAAPAGGCSLSFTSSTVSAGTVGAPYTATVTVTGGTAPYTYSVSNGSLPSGLSLSSNGAISGTPTTSGTYTFSVLATDSSGSTGVQSYSLTINPSAPTAGNVNQTIAYNTGSASPTSITLSLSGGAATSVAVASGPSHGTANASGTTISYTPAANYIGADSFTYTASNAGGTSSAATVSITISAPTITLSPGSLPAVAVGTAYSQTITASGGLASYTFAVTAGTLPAGLSLSSAGALTGTPTAAGTASFTITATDSSSGTHATGSQAYSLTVNAAAPIAGNVSQTIAYNSGSASPTSITLSLSGGVATSVAVAGSPSHGTATASGTSISYTPTANYIGTDSFTYTASNSTGTSATATVSITVNAPAVTLSPGSLPAGTVGSPYSQTLTASGGLAPHTFSIAAGSLPTGLTLSSAGLLSGTPVVAATDSFTIAVVDNSSGTSAGISQVYTLTVNTALPAAPTAGNVSQTIAYNSGSASPAAVNLSLGGGAATNVAVASSATHGTAIASGTGISYTPAANYIGTDSFTYTASNGSGTSSAATVSITISAPMLTLSPGSLSNATVGTVYLQNFFTSGGLATYTYAVTAGALPSGLSLSSAGELSGTPTNAGTSNFTVTVTDSSSGTPVTAIRAYTITTNPALVPAPTATPGTVTATFNNGDNAATTLSIILGGGTTTGVAITAQPTHGTAAVNGLSITYTPNVHYYGQDTLTYIASNTSGSSAPAILTITIAAPTLAASVVTASRTVVEASSVTAFAPVTSSGGVAPLQYSINPALPSGLDFDPGTGRISGTPTVTTSMITYTVTITDAANQVVSGTFSMLIQAASGTLAITPNALPHALYTSPYAAQLSADGGIAPYTWSLAGGTLPNGLSLSSAGLISGRPTATSSFTVAVTDAQGHTGSRSYALNVIARPDPAQDASVRAMLAAQAAAITRLARTQSDNVFSHLQQFHGNFDVCAAASTANLSFHESSLRNPDASAVALPLSQQALPVDNVAEPAVGSRDEGCPNRRLFGSARIGLWSGGSLNYGNAGVAGVAGGHFTSDGLTFGLESQPRRNLIFGLALGYGWNETAADNPGLSTDAIGDFAAAYAAYRLNAVVEIDAVLGNGRLRSSNRREIAADRVPVNGDRDGSSLFAAVAVSSTFHRAGLTLEPSMSAAVIDSRLEAYQEAGTTDLALSYEGVNVTSISLAGGLTALYDLPLLGAVLTPVARVRYQCVFDRIGSQKLYYSDFGRNALYATAAATASQGLTGAQLGLRYRNRSGMQGEISYGYSIDGHAHVSRSVEANLRLGF